jgi:hypothetical protein
MSWILVKTNAVRYNDQIICVILEHIVEIINRTTTPNLAWIKQNIPAAEDIEPGKSLILFNVRDPYKKIEGLVVALEAKFGLNFLAWTPVNTQSTIKIRGWSS